MKPNDIKVVVRFQTQDGKEFDNLEEALNHNITPSYRMWSDKDDNITETAEIEAAAYVYLPHDDAAELFKRNSEEGGMCIEGITGAGWFMWSHEDFCYLPMNEALGKLFLAL